MTDWRTEVAEIMAAPPEGLSAIGGVAPSDIDAAQLSLGVEFPASYRWFLATYGALMSPDPVYGLGAGVQPWMNVVAATEAERHEFEPPLRAELVAVSADGWGNHYCLDTAALQAGECPVVFWSHELDSDQPCPVVAPTFGAWLRQVLADELEWTG